jgi:hypothetical protein
MNPKPARTLLACPGSTSDSYHFPVGTFREKYSGADKFARDWYSKHLMAMKEPSLSCGEVDYSEAYRFLWLRNFHQPIAVRISRTGDAYTLRIVQTSGAGGYRPGDVLRAETRTLTATQWQKLKVELKKANFWKEPTEPPPDGIVGLDGAQWIFEGRFDDYHIVDRWSAEGPFRELGLVFIDLADLIDQVGPIY